MELNTILELVKAGFTKDEIMQMAQPSPTVPDPEPTPVDTPAQIAEPVPEPVAEPVAVAQPVAQPAQAQEQKEPTMAELMQSIAKLTSAVQANAIAQSVMPQGVSNPPSAESMLAEIIRPTFHQRSE